MTIVAGPNQLLIDEREYPILFGTMSSIKLYQEEVRKAEDSYQESVSRAKKALENAKEIAMTNLKKSLDESEGKYK